MVVNLRKLATVGFFKSGLKDLYHEFADTPSSYRNQIKHELPKQEVYDPLRRKLTNLAEFATYHGMDKDMPQYLDDWFDSRQGKIGRAMHVTSSISDSIDDLVELIEIGSTATIAGAPGAQASNAVQLPGYFVAKSIYNAVNGALGFAGEIYRPNMHGVTDYVFDSGKTYLGGAASSVPLVGGAFELLTNMDDRMPRIKEAAARDVHYRMLRKLGLPEQEAIKFKYKSRRGLMKDDGLKMYEGPDERLSYGTDFRPGTEIEQLYAGHQNN